MGTFEFDRNDTIVLYDIKWNPAKCLRDEIAGNLADQSTARTASDCDAMQIDTLSD